MAAGAPTCWRTLAADHVGTLALASLPIRQNDHQCKLEWSKFWTLAKQVMAGKADC
jgi:hypothetical protein